MVLENSSQRDFFIDTAYDIANSLGYTYTKEDIESMVIEDEYKIHLEPIDNNHIHIGIYTVGKWNCKCSEEDSDVSVCCNDVIEKEIPYVDRYKDFDILVFATHEWSEDGFNAIYSNLSEEIVYNDVSADEHKEHIINEINYYQKNPIKAYYDLVDFDEICLCHKSTGSRVKVFCKAWFKNVILKKFKSSDKIS